MDKTAQINPLILELIREYDLLIIPGFGALVCQSVQCEIDAKNQLIHPPTREISFNPDIKKNDATLARRLADKLQIKYGAALVHVDFYVRNLKETLEKENAFEIKGVGTFVKEDGKLRFEVTSSLPVSLENFGLQAVKWKGEIPTKSKERKENSSLKEKESKLPKKKAQESVEQNIAHSPKEFRSDRVEKRAERKDQKKSKKNPYPLYFILAALIFLSQLIIWDVKPEVLQSSPLNIIHYNPVEDLVSNELETITVQPDFKPMEYISIPTVQSTGLKNGFYVVLGSFQYQKNGQNLVRQLKDSGFEAYFSKSQSGMYRVVVPASLYQEQAIDNLNYFKSTWNTEAWILENRI